MSAQDEIDRLRTEVEQLQLNKLELIRSTSSELERLRQTIRFLTGKTDLKTVNSIGYSPLSGSERQLIKDGISTQHPRIDLNELMEKILIEKQREWEMERIAHSQTQSRRSNDETNYNDTSNGDNSNKNDASQSQTNKTGNANKEENNSATNGNGTEPNKNGNDSNNANENNSENNSNSESFEQGIDVSRNQNGLATINEDESQSDGSNSEQKNDKKRKQVQISSTATIRPNGSKKQADASYRLSIKRMSRQGFIFSELGFMTTDFEQLQRGHTQWVNHVIHHPLQNGICISASNDSCIFFWRMREYASGKEELSQEKYDARIIRYSSDHSQQRAMIEACKENQPNLQANHSAGEIKLHPLLKINTGVHIKAIGMSKEGNLLACVCYDDEEEEADPELELYYDEEQLWCFQQDHSDYGHSANSMKGGRSADRIIRRKVIGLPFPPVDRAIAFSNDSRYVFVGLESTKDREIDGDSDDDSDEESERKDQWPEEACTMVCIDVTTKMVRPCSRINDLMASNEYVRCFAISPDGLRMAIGTSLGRLIVTGVRALTGVHDTSEPDGNENASLWRIWIGDDIDGAPTTNDVSSLTNNNSNNSNGKGGKAESGNGKSLDGNIDGGLSAIIWSGDNEWVLTGYYTGSIKLWKKNKEPRLSINVNRALNIMMKRAHVSRKSKLFTCKWMLEGLHVESINSFSIKGSLLVSGSDDGTIIIHDLCQTLIDNNSAGMAAQAASQDDKHNTDDDDKDGDSNDDDGNKKGGNKKKVDDLSNNSPSTLGKIDRLHGGRMVTSVNLTPNYGEESLLVPTAGLFMVSSGADNVIHCLSMLDVLRNSIRTKFYNQKV